jgi:hypothetical protein
MEASTSAGSEGAFKPLNYVNVLGKQGNNSKFACTLCDKVFSGTQSRVLIHLSGLGTVVTHAACCMLVLSCWAGNLCMLCVMLLWHGAHMCGCPGWGCMQQSSMVRIGQRIGLGTAQVLRIGVLRIVLAYCVLGNPGGGGGGAHIHMSCGGREGGGGARRG